MERAYSIKRYGTWQSSYIAIGSASKTVAHNADGTRSVGISVKYSNSGTNQAGTYSGSGTVTLDRIPRASGISTAASFTAGEPFYRGDQSKFQLVYPYCIGEGKWS